MGLEMVRRSFFGISFAALFTFIALTIFKVQGIEVPVSVIWSNMLGSLLIGIYFGAASMIFDVERWSPLKQTSVHFLLSCMVFFPIAFTAGWIPFEALAVILGFSIFIALYAMFWFGTRAHLKKLETAMNHSVKK